MNHHEHDHHSPDHHGHGNPFLIPFALILVFAVIEFFGGVWTQSLALLGDAWHMFSDVVALGIAMFASYQATKAGNSRAELVASVVNALAMLIVATWIIVEAFERIASPRPVTGGYVMLIAFVGLVVNLLAAKYLHHHGDAENMNQRAAFLHVMRYIRIDRCTGSWRDYLLYWLVNNRPYFIDFDFNFIAGCDIEFDSRNLEKL